MNDNKRFVSLKTKFMFSTLIPVVASYLLIGSVVFIMLFNSLHETAKAEILQISQKYAHGFERKINTATDYLSLVSSTFELRVATGFTDRKMAQETVMHTFNSFGLIDGSSIYFEPDMYDGNDAEYIGTKYGTNKSGRICYYFYRDDGKTVYLPEALENDIEFDLPHYTDAKEANKTITTAPAIHEVEGRKIPMFTITYPVRDTSGLFIGAVTVDLFLADMYAQLQNESIYETGYIIIVDDKDRIIYSPRFEDIGKTREEVGIYYAFPEKDESAAFVTGKSILNDKDTLIAVESIFIPQLESCFYISVAVPMTEINARGIQLVVALAAFIIIAVVMIAFLLYYLIARISAPIKDITENANKIADGDTDKMSAFVWSKVKTIDEVYILSMAIEKMLSQLNDVQKLKLEALELKHKKEKAETSVQAKNDFLAKMSHEIRTPMNAVIGITELVLREEISPAVYEHILGIKNAGNNLLSIINDILDFSKIESGKLEIVSSEYIFTSLINDVINIIRVKTSEKPVYFIVNLDSSIPEMLIGDEVRIRQIMINLLSNAVKYTYEGFISLTIDGEIMGDNTVLLNIEVSDSGIGIKPEDIDKLFGNFVQVDMASNKGVQGTGLGLAITKSLCQAMGGDISVYSQYGEGSSFTLFIPQKFNKYEKFAFVSDPSEKKVLLYETREIYADSISCSIDNLGVECVLAHDRETFYEALEGFNFPYVFVSSFLFESAKQIINELKASPKLVLLAEYGEVVAEKNIKIIAMPVHSISIANILNDITDNAGYGGSDVNIAFSAPDARILIVDDIPTNLKVAEGLMAPYQMQVDTCLSGKAAIKMIQSKSYDIIFMDHMMPEMDGIETTHRIRALDGEYYSSLPIVALTANAVAGVKEMFLQNGMNDFLAKPVETSKLNSVLERWLPREKTKAQAVQKIKTPSIQLEIEGVDVSSGITATGGNANHYMTVLSLFYKDCVEKIAQIKDCEGMSDINLYVTYVHALKSALYSIGARDLSEFAKNLENAGRSGDVAYIEHENESFLQRLQKLLEQIDNAVSSRYEDDRSKDEIDVTLLVRLKQAFIDMDVQTADDILKELNSLNPGRELGSAIEKIYQDFLMFEYDEAISVIDRLLEEQGRGNEDGGGKK